MRGKKGLPIRAMDQPLHNYMRPGIVLCVAYPAAAVNSEALLRGVESVAADPFFSAVELRHAPDDATRRRITQVLRISRLDVVYETYPRARALGLDLNSRDETARARAVDECKRAIAEATDIGAERINVASGRDPGPAAREAATDALVDSLYTLAAYAADIGAPPLALEPFPRMGPEGHLIGPTAEAVGLVRLVRDLYPDFGLSLDTGHMALMGEDVAGSFVAAAPYLGQIHLANALPGAMDGTDTAPPFGVGGAYDVHRVGAVLLSLFRIGFLGGGQRPLVCFRVAPRADERAEWIIAGAKRTLTEAWTRL